MNTMDVVTSAVSPKVPLEWLHAAYKTRNCASQAAHFVESSPPAFQASSEDAAAASDAVVVEAASGLAAVAALVQGLGSFLSPYLPDILAATLGPQVQGAALTHG